MALDDATVTVSLKNIKNKVKQIFHRKYPWNVFFLGSPKAGSLVQTIVWKSGHISPIWSRKSLGDFSKFGGQVYKPHSKVNKAYIKRFKFQLKQMPNAIRSPRLALFTVISHHNFNQINIKNCPSIVSSATNRYQ